MSIPGVAYNTLQGCEPAEGGKNTHTDIDPSNYMTVDQETGGEGASASAGA